MAHYASRLMDQITTPKPILIGLSFGGMIAVEVAKQLETEKLILLASAKTKGGIPLLYRLAGKLGLHQIVPVRLLKSSNFISNWLFGAQSEADKQLLKQILADTDPGFLKRAIHQITHWENTTVHPNCVHIHGTKDHILPIRLVNADISVKDGGHLIPLNKAIELSQIISCVLNPEQ